MVDSILVKNQYRETGQVFKNLTGLYCFANFFWVGRRPVIRQA